jgi:predicted DNA-binding protein (UPF0251 family)
VCKSVLTITVDEAGAAKTEALLERTDMEAAETVRVELRATAWAVLLEAALKMADCILSNNHINIKSI